MSRASAPPTPQSAPGGIDALLAALAGFGLTGMIVGALTLGLNPEVHRHAGDAVTLVLFFGLLYAGLGLAPGLVAAAGLWIARLVRLPVALRRLLGLAAVSTLLLLPLAYALLLPAFGFGGGELLREFLFNSAFVRRISVLLAAVVSATLVGALAAALLRWMGARRPAAVRGLVAAAWLLPVVGILLWAVLARPRAAAAVERQAVALPQLPAELAEQPPPRVILLCIDGMDPDLVEELIAAGDMPALERLRREGTWGELESFPPGRSHPIWTSIVTGRTPEEHGVRNFTTVRIPGVAHTVEELPLHSGINKVLPRVLARLPGSPSLHAPYTSNMRRTEALWNMVGHYWPVGQYRWLVTYPAEPVNGFYVAGGMRWAQFVFGFREEVARGLPGGAVHPPDVFAGIDLPPRPEVPAEVYQRYAGPQGTVDPEADWYAMVTDFVSAPTATVVPELIEKYDTRFAAVGFYSVDSHEHLLGHYHQKGGPFSDAVQEAYRFADARLAELVEAVGDDVNLLVISDHGYDFEANHHVDAPPGIFVARGPAFAAGAGAEGLSVFDIAPLVLRLLRLPLPADLPGTASGAYAAALSPEFLAAQPETRIATYETGERRDEGAVESALDEEITDVLRSLGYIE